MSWVDQDPITKSKRITNSSGTIVSSIELDPWGADAGAAWSSNSAFQPRKFTTYDRDANGTDEAMFRRYNRWHSRFDQPDPYDGSYDFTNPQSFNRYSYTQNDPVSFVDPIGLDGDLGGRSGITLNPPSGSVTITVSFDDFFRHGGSSGDGTEWRTLAVIDPGDLNHGMAGSIQLKPQIAQDIQPRNLLANIFHLLDDNRCSTFVSNLINVARQLTGKKPYTYDGKELAVAVARQENGGFIFSSGANGGGGGGAAYGDIFSGQGTVQIGMFNTAHTGPRDYQGGYAMTALHEIIHLAGGGASAYDGSRAYYMDVVLADAAKILTGAPGYSGSYNRNTPPWQITAEMTGAAGDYWDAQLKQYCMPQEWRRQ